jgi:phage shock protein E
VIKKAELGANPGVKAMSVGLIAVVAIVVIGIVWYSMNNGGMMNGAGAQRISPQEYQTGVAKQQHMLIDVRTTEEFRAGHIPGAVNIELQLLPVRMATLPKAQPIVLYCRSGARSSNAAQMLKRAGFENVRDLGGIMTWQAQGLPVH